MLDMPSSYGTMKSMPMAAPTHYSSNGRTNVSHITTIKTQIKDLDILRRACTRLKIGEPTRANHRMYGGQVEGWGVKLSGWNYPVVMQDDGQVKFDNYGGSWGEQARLDELQQAYSAEACINQAEMQGYGYSESLDSDGTIHLEIDA